MAHDERNGVPEFLSRKVTRRQVLKGAAAVGGAFALGPVIGACGGDDGGGGTTNGGGGGEPKMGGDLRVGIVGGSAKDTADPHMASFEPDIALEYQVYDGLTAFDNDYQLVNHLAESIEPNDDASAYQVKLKSGLTWQDGKPVTADDVVYTFERILDPDDPKTGAATLTGLTPGNIKKVDDLTVDFTLDAPNVLLPEAMAFRGNMLVPVDFDPKAPIGCGPFKLDDFKPGEQFTFSPFEEYWGEGPYVASMTIIEFADETARVNALQSGSVEIISQLPRAQYTVIEGAAGLMVLDAKTGAWQPFTMRIDQKPFDDVRVRQAFRLIPDRQQMIDQAYAGLGWVGNDMYAPFDPGTPDLAQREQDLEEAKSLLKQAGAEGLTVELVTSDAVGGGAVEAAQVFAENAKGADVKVNVKKVDAGIFYGEDYLSWTFAMDFWYTRNYLAQAGQGTMPGAPYNETHWKNDKWLAIVNEAFRTVDEAKRNELIGEAQTIEYEEGGYIVWSFNNQTDAYSDKVAGLTPDKGGVPCGQWSFKDVYFT